MSDAATFIAISNEELLARFITASKWFRSDNSVRQDAFIPYPNRDLSVTRHGLLTEQELWEIGQEIANARPVNLYGRADIVAEDIRRQKLTIEPMPVPENANHACILGWPSDKPAQKIRALELAAAAKFIPKP